MNALGRFSIALAVGLACLPAAARGQHATPPRAPAVRVPAPETLTGIGPERNGKTAGSVFVADRAAIAAGAIPVDGQGLPVTSAAANAVAPEPFEGMNARLLDRDVTATFASLNHCRTDAAPRKRPPPAHITMDSLTLRWTIAGKGQVAAMDVVGSTPLDPDVLDCINRDTNGWLFMSPVGGEARLNRALVFRRLSSAAVRP
jgi:hypothetical protein